MSNPFSTENLLRRQAQLGQALSAGGFDAVALNAGPSQVYLSGLHFHLMERPAVLLLAAGKTPVMVLPDFEKGKLADLGFALEAVTYGENPVEWQAAFDKAAALIGPAKKIGVEGLRLRVMELRYLEAAFPGAQFPIAEELIADMRKLKDAGEIAAMQKAVEIAEGGLEATLQKIKIGMSEKEISGILVQELYALGSDPELPFAPIVAAAANSANPHATASDYKIKAGDLLLIDWGASYNGYLSDLTRTFAVGEISEEFKRIYEIVKLANQAGREAAAIGAACAVVDEAARDAIEDNGYGQYFTHRTGHGLGMEGHEEPYMRGDNRLPLAEGMSFTVEPGIYLDGRGGVRIEDDVVMTADGPRSLSTFPRELRVVG
ncbi:MAG TPA: aminopeptidase P family protein [Anaerolineales bacterium]|nr:aminopeptidase P family protein [Anaerolineales bacterium]HRQ92118.1 aminopeptidase P family protein [Anaerolineales bacterium]